MPKKFRYNCTGCGNMPGSTRDEARNNLFAKRVEFREYGFRGRLLRSRVIAWLCKACLEADEDYKRSERELADRMTR